VLATTIARAFHGLPASRYLVPDPGHREKVFPTLFGFDVADTLLHGSAQATAAGEAVALWMPAGAFEDPEPELDPRIEQIDHGLALRYLRFHQILHKNHPRGRPHHWLMILAVRPEQQSRGLGSKLLERHHADLDSQRLPAYLEAASATACKLYRRHGYIEIGGPITLPNDTRMFPMWREPRTS
jgi:GNAT superfamily N-acetyltransferase